MNPPPETALQSHGRRPSAFLAELLDSDWLGLRPLVRARLRSRWLLLEPGRVVARAAARVTYRALAPDGGGDGADDLAGCVDAAIADCLSIDRRGARRDGRGGPPAAPGDHALFAQTFGAGPAYARRASRDFHGLPVRARRALIELWLERQPVDQVVERSGLDRDELRRELKLALDAATGTMARTEAATPHSHFEGQP